MMCRQVLVRASLLKDEVAKSSVWAVRLEDLLDL